MTWEHFYTSFLVPLFFLLVPTVMGYFTYHQRKNQEKTDRSIAELKTKQEEIADRMGRKEDAIKETINSNMEKMYREFVCKDEYHRDINSLEKKMDDMKDLLLGLNRDIGMLVGKGEK